MKKIMSLILVVCLLLGTTSTAFAQSQTVNFGTEKKTGYVDITETVAISESEALQYNQYLPTSFNILNRTQTEQKLSNDLVSNLNLLDTKMVGTNLHKSYSLEQVEAFFPNCKQMIDISVIGGVMYIQYIANDDNEVILSYQSNVLREICVYEPDSDRLVLITETEKSAHLNFRHGSYYEIPEQDYAAIIAFMENPEECELPVGFVETQLLDGSTVINNINNTIFDSMNSTNANRARYKGFTSEAEMFADLKSNFPQLNYTSTFVRDCPILNDDITVTVQRVRDSYVKVHADFRSFARDIALTAVALYLGGGVTVTIVEQILTGLGIGFTVNGYLQEIVTLYRASEYTFQGSLFGRVYDETSYNTYVNVKRYLGSGKYAGGYNSQGEYHWVESIVCAALDRTDGALATEAANLYNSDLTNNGYCTYNPYIW